MKENEATFNQEVKMMLKDIKAQLDRIEKLQEASFNHSVMMFERIRVYLEASRTPKEKMPGSTNYLSQKKKKPN
jgi:hypothetical protein